MEKEIELNGKKYILKEDAKGKKRPNEVYPHSIEAKLITKLSKLLGEETECMSEFEALNAEQVTCMDAANVCMVIAKTDRAKCILRRFIYQDKEKIDKVPELDYKVEKDKELEIDSRYSADYLLKCFDFFNVFNSRTEDHGVNMRTMKDYPLTLYDDDWQIILAPKIETD